MKIYAARWVLPIISSAIADGAVAIDGSKIVAVDSRANIVAKFPAANVLEFGKAAILPGFVNAHSHLELTVMRGFLESQEHDFFTWLRKLTLARMAMTDEDLRISAICGAIEAVRAGVTCVADSSSLAAQTIKGLREIGLRGLVYQESFGPDPRLASENIVKLREQIAQARNVESHLVRAGISPHAPYTVSAPQMEMISRIAINEKLPLMMHAAESQAEQSFMLHGVGPFAEGLRKRGIEWQAPGISSIAYLGRHGVLETKPLLAHCVTATEADVELIKKNAAGIAHCPKSNAKLGHGRAPFWKFISNGINVGLGSDSVASNNTCDILEEARFATLFARAPSADDEFRSGLPPAVSSVSAEDALLAATLGGARALGLGDQIGALAEGMQADIAIVRLDGAHQQPVQNPTDTLIFSSSGRDVVLTLVAGKEIYRNGLVVTIDETEFQRQLTMIRNKMDSIALV